MTFRVKTYNSLLYIPQLGGATST